MQVRKQRPNSRHAHAVIGFPGLASHRSLSQLLGRGRLSGLSGRALAWNWLAALSLECHESPSCGRVLSCRAHVLSVHVAVPDSSLSPVSHAVPLPPPYTLNSRRQPCCGLTGRTSGVSAAIVLIMTLAPWGPLPVGRCLGWGRFWLLLFCGLAGLDPACLHRCISLSSVPLAVAPLAVLSLAVAVLTLWWGGVGLAFLCALLSYGVGFGDVPTAPYLESRASLYTGRGAVLLLWRGYRAVRLLPRVAARCALRSWFPGGL